MPVSVPESGLEIGAGSRVVAELRPNREHSHPFYELLCVTEGHTHVVIRGRKMVAGPGDLLIYYPDEKHAECVQVGRFSIIWLRFDPKRLNKPINFPSQEAAGPLVHLPWPERFQHLFTQMLIEQRIRDPWSEVMMTGYLTQFTVLLQRALRCLGTGDSGSPPEKCSRVGMALQLIHNSLDRDVSLKELASQSYMSESHFSHSFKELTGVSPKRYLIRAKILRAEELLRSTDMSVQDVAMNLGYDDAHYFSKVFRKMTGKSPTEFRASSAGEAST